MLQFLFCHTTRIASNDERCSMGTQRTAPAGYSSNFTAILDVIRYGPGIWGPIKTTVLLWHIERSTAYGWQSDQHSESQATAGIYSTELRKWIRGPAGVGAGTYHRSNATLLSAGLITKQQRTTMKGGHAATEYAPDWLAIRAAITDWQEQTPVPRHSRDRQTQGFPFSQNGRRASPTAEEAFSQSGRRASPRVGDTVVSSSSFTVVSESRAPEAAEPPSAAVAAASPDPPTFPSKQNDRTTAGEVAAAIEAAYGRPLKPADAIPGRLLAIAKRLGLGLEPLCWWIAEWFAAKRAANYPITSPQLLVKAAAEDLIPWMRNNHRTLAIHASEQERRRYREDSQRAEAQPAMLPPPQAEPQFSQCPICNQETVYEGTCTSPQCVERRLSARVQTITNR